MIAHDRLSGDHEALLIGWWANLDSERAQLFHTRQQGLGGFLDHFNHHANLMFETDRAGIWFAAWTEAWCDGAIFSLWIRKPRRCQPSARKAMEFAYNLALRVYPVLVGFTLQPQLHALHLKLGYEYGGRVPGLIAGQTVYCYYLTREGWDGRHRAAQDFRMRRKLQHEQKASPNGVVH